MKGGTKRRSTELRLRAAGRPRRCARCSWPKFRRPILVFIDTPAAYPGIESENAVVEAIAVNLREMMLLDTPTIVAGGEGAAAARALRSAIGC